MNGSISSLQHPLVKHLVKLRTDSAYRQQNQKILLEGAKPIQEVSHLVDHLLYTPAYEDKASCFKGLKWEITDAVLKKISGMASPEGLLAEVRMPSMIEISDEKRVLALDGVSDPGNLGTLLRTALAFQWDAVYFLPGCCDPFNEKAVRAARGAHFKLPLAKGEAENLIVWARKNEVTALLADLNGENPEVIEKSKRCLLVLGNEAHGASDRIREFSQSVSIPMPGKMESLNVAVAGGILLYLFSIHNFKGCL